jgi:hypothetical protein
MSVTISLNSGDGASPVVEVGPCGSTANPLGRPGIHAQRYDSSGRCSASLRLVRPVVTAELFASIFDRPHAARHHDVACRT